MGTKTETTELQCSIKELASKLGWSQNKLARVIYSEINEWDDEDEIKKFQERFKQELRRPSTKPVRLKEYLSVLARHPDVEKLEVSSNKYISSGHLRDSLINGMKGVSKEIDAVIESAYNKGN